MKTLSEFLAVSVVNKDDFSSNNSFDEPEYNEIVAYYQHRLANGIKAYQAYLKGLNTDRFSVAMREIELAGALDRIEQNAEVKDSCNHKWVARLDGYEEQCGPAICNLCGKYGCYCDAKWTKMTDAEKVAFDNNGIHGDNHALRDKLKLRCRNCTRRYTSCNIYKVTPAASCSNYTTLRTICPIGEYTEKDFDMIDPKRCDFNPNQIDSSYPKCTQACFLKLREEYRPNIAGL